MAIALVCFAMALTGLAVAGYGLSTMASARRLEGRVSRLIAPVARLDSPGFRIRGLLVARGRDRTEIETKLQQAGFQHPQAMEYFLWIRLGSTGAMVLLAGAASHIISGSFFKPFLLVVVGGATYLLSKRGLALFATARQRAITAEFPFLLDLMLMMLESGISLDQCFRAIAAEDSHAAPLLTASVQALVTDLNRGMSYESALDRWASRLGVAGARELSSLFQKSLFQGIELSPALREFVREFTDRRVGAAREAMGKISVKMVMVMMLCFLPALMIVIGGPPVSSLIETLGSVKQ